jgi:hypothetical protein
MVVIKNILKIMSVCVLFAFVVAAQEPTPPQTPEAKPDPSILKEFTRSVSINGVMMNFVLVNDKTVDVLFQAPSKYSLRARARMSTLFYVQGTPDKDLDQVNTKYTIEQDGQTADGTPINIKNFEGGAVAKGNRIDGLLQFEKKLDLTHEFKIKGAKTVVDFKLSSDALKLLGL